VDGKFPKPHLILLDLNMPVMDGWEFLDNYENLSEEQRAKIVLVLLTTSKNYKDINGYENKPLSVIKMEHIINKYLKVVKFE
jgi:CheY-like chemotaxis protein